MPNPHDEAHAMLPFPGVKPADSIEGWVQCEVVGVPVDRALRAHSIIQDLELSHRCFATLLARDQDGASIRPTGEFDPIDVALAQTAVFTYSRSFDAGVRKATGDRLMPPPGDWRKLHNRLIDLRNEHLAHFDHKSVDEQMRTVLRINVDPETGEVLSRITGVGTKGMGMARQAIEAFLELVRRVLVAAIKELNAASAQLYADLERQLTADQRRSIWRSGKGRTIRVVDQEFTEAT